MFNFPLSVVTEHLTTSTLLSVVLKNTLSLSDVTLSLKFASPRSVKNDLGATTRNIIRIVVRDWESESTLGLNLVTPSLKLAGARSVKNDPRAATRNIIRVVVCDWRSDEAIAFVGVGLLMLLVGRAFRFDKDVGGVSRLDRDVVFHKGIKIGDWELFLVVFLCDIDRR